MSPHDRTAALRAARRSDSDHKRQKVLAAVEALEAAGSGVTFAGVAAAAGVSRWLVYADGVRDHVEAARRRQAGGATSAPPAPPNKPRASPASLRADLAIARTQIAALRDERDKLRHRLRLQLGADIDGPDRVELIARVADLDAVNRQLVAERDARDSERRDAQRRVTELEDELTAVRESLRRIMRDKNRQR
ncbi:MAG: DUF6262 family protein [Acidimicrobiales bacterium]